MKVVILAGGFGTRISEESTIKPKPMINIGDTPVLVHLLRYFYENGYDDFIICGGYKCEYIKNYFHNYNIINSDLTIDNREGKNTYHINNKSEKWRISIVDTGINTQTGGRIKNIESFIGEDESFIMTYGDGLSDINLISLVNEYNKSDSIVTLSSYQKESKFGILNLDGDNVMEFSEKSISGGGWINAGFMVLNKEIFKYIKNQSDSFEFDILPIIAKLKKLTTYKHTGFWKCMDTLKDKNEFEDIISSGNIPWKKN